ncbi:MAG: hypothetical protein WBX19_21595 [Terracidiphilus sp.]|jgi:hypothetical protein
MNLKLMVKFLVASGLGAACGLMVHLDHERWLRAGRDAFLTDQGRRFDHQVAVPQSEFGIIVTAVIMTLGFFAFYEGIVYVGTWLATKSVGPTSSKSNEVATLS